MGKSQTVFHLQNREQSLQSVLLSQYKGQMFVLRCLTGSTRAVYEYVYLCIYYILPFSPKGSQNTCNRSEFILANNIIQLYFTIFVLMGGTKRREVTTIRTGSFSKACLITRLPLSADVVRLNNEQSFQII